MHGPSPPSQSAGAEEILAPTVVRLDAHGRAVSQHTTVQKKQVAIDALPWAKWVELETKTADETFAKLSLENVILQLHRTFMADPPNISMVRQGKDIAMRTKERFPKAKLVIPIFSGKQTPWLWMVNRVGCDLAMASIARSIGLGGL